MRVGGASEDAGLDEVGVPGGEVVERFSTEDDGEGVVDEVGVPEEDGVKEAGPATASG